MSEAYVIADASGHVMQWHGVDIGRFYWFPRSKQPEHGVAVYFARERAQEQLDGMIASGGFDEEYHRGCRVVPIKWPRKDGFSLAVTRMAIEFLAEVNDALEPVSAPSLPVPEASSTVKCLAMWQPWATLWLLEGEKEFETRHWATHHKGPLLVHAAKARNKAVQAALADPVFIEALARHGMNAGSLAFGAIIGIVDLVGCYYMVGMNPSERERHFGLWRNDRYAWMRKPNAVLFESPIPHIGRQRVFNVPKAVIGEYGAML